MEVKALGGALDKHIVDQHVCGHRSEDGADDNHDHHHDKLRPRTIEVEHRVQQRFFRHESKQKRQARH